MNNLNANQTTFSNYKAAGYTTLIGAIIMVIGAALWGTSGTDLWAALAENQMAEYLSKSAAVKTQLIANLSVWIIGVTTLGVAGRMMTDLSDHSKAANQFARVFFNIAVPLGILSYIFMLAVVVLLTSGGTELETALATVTGWIGARTDDYATALIIGLAPAMVGISAKDIWMPRWLGLWGFINAAIGIFSVVVLYTSVPQLGFIIIPFGVAWMIAAGIILIRRKPENQ
ncbi:MAG: hypothetical protein GYB31_16110 [Bacteroidetes bacterium]|nr:hypothetical protein [Bacteroidota bacterium]